MIRAEPETLPTMTPIRIIMLRTDDVLVSLNGVMAGQRTLAFTIDLRTPPNRPNDAPLMTFGESLVPTGHAPLADPTFAMRVQFDEPKRTFSPDYDLLRVVNGNINNQAGTAQFSFELHEIPAAGDVEVVIHLRALHPEPMTGRLAGTAIRHAQALALPTWDGAERTT